MQKVRQTFGGYAMAKACGLGMVSAMIITLLMASLTAVFISNEYFEMNAGQYFAVAIMYLSVFFGSLIAGKIVAERRVVTCSIIGIVYFLLQIGEAILFFDGASGNVIIGFVACLLGCGAAILLCVKEKRRSGSSRNRKHSR